MATGTQYTEKSSLLNAITSLVYTNVKNEVSADKAQKAMKDIVESLWGGGTIINDVVYADLVSDMQLNQLVAGDIYKFTYQCVHKMPHTSVLNIDSPNYVSNTETFYAKALDNNRLSPVVVSSENPKDLILFDFTKNLAEDGSTARTGKVIYRKDQEKNLETAYDFRGVYFRRYAIDYGSYTVPQI